MKTQRNRNWGWMNTRVVGIIIKDNHILLMHRFNKGEHYFVFIGGTIDPDESQEHALKREIKEETHLRFKQHQKMFAMKNQSRQEVYYLVSQIKGTAKLGGPEKDRMTKENQYRLVWVELSKLSSLKNIYPKPAVKKILEYLAENRSAKKRVVVAVSGGFDPLHAGHVRMFKAAKKLGDELVVILNNDNWLKLKKGYNFMSAKERKEIIEALESVDRVVISKHVKNTKDMSVCKELELIKPNIFANGGDRKLNNVPEVATCKKIGCKMVFNVGHGGKMQSSSWLLDQFFQKRAKNKR